MDRDLVIRAQQRDHLAFESLMIASHDRLFRLAHGILRDPHLAEDATQQAFLDIWREIDRLRDPARYDAWSYRVTVRICYAEARRKPRWATSTEVPAFEGPQARDPFETVVERDRLERAFARLSIDHRVVIVMRFLLDMSPEQMAEILDVPRRTVYSRLKRAVPAMRAALEADARPVDPTVRWQEALR